MAHRPVQIVPATAASALVFGDALPPVHAFDAPDHGEATLHLPSLRAHAGRGYDLAHGNCVVRWARIPAGYSGPVDVVVHFHGYVGSVHSMRLTQKAAISGLDLQTPGVARPTIGLVPHGFAHEWHYTEERPDHTRVQRTGDGFTFPAIDSKDELDAFIAEALAAWAAQPGNARVSRSRVLLTGHSGGGAALTKLMQSIGAAEGVQGFHYFDATYGGQDVLTAASGWAAAAIERDLAQLGAAGSPGARELYLSERASALRICFIDGSGTANVAKAAQAFLQGRLAQVADAGARAALARRYRAQKTVHLVHNDVPRTFGGRLLADSGDDLAPQAQAVPAAPARAHQADDPWDEDAYRAAAYDAWKSEAQDTVTVPVLVRRERAADAPTGSAFIASLGSTVGVERENRIYAQLAGGNLPTSLLTFHTVRTSAADRQGRTHEVEYYVMPDVLSIGTESDSVRIPMDAVTAQRVADLFECLLPTARMVDQIYRNAPTKLAFIDGHYAGTPRAHLQAASSAYLDHSRAIDAQLRRPPTLLTAGHKKELVITSNYLHQGRHDQHPVPKLAFYGAFTASGEPIQHGAGPRGMPSFAHEPSYVDYSHGVRLVWPTMRVDGQERPVSDVLRDADLAPLIAAEGAIATPRYTPTRAGAPARAHGADGDDDDPLALANAVSESLGYGTNWDERIRTTVEGFLAGYMAIAVTVGGQSQRVHPPYFINVGDHSAQASRDRFDRARQHRAAAPAALRTLLGQRRFGLASIGKATRDAVRDLLESADAQGLLLTDATVRPAATPDKLRAFLQHYGIGIDCSGFVGQAINLLVDLLPGAVAADRLAEPLSTSSAALKGGQGAFDRVTDPAQLCGGDTMWLQGHIRILSWAERRGTNIVFCTAESRASRPADIGPAVCYWRLVPDAHAAGHAFSGWRLERSSDLNAPDSGWTRDDSTHVFGHYRPLRSRLGAARVTPTALQAASCATPPRTADTGDLTQAEVDRLAAMRFRDSAAITAVFSRCGHTDFYDWYNAGLAHSAPFAARGATPVTPALRRNFATFWDQLATAYDQPEISALEFATLMAIVINEGGGDFGPHVEAGGGENRDARGPHSHLAYFFDAIAQRRSRSGRTIRAKRSYNTVGSNRRAGALFDDAQFVDAHGALAGANRLAHHGSEFGGAWNGEQYPQGEFSVAEDLATNGFIMQADFYKFRGRGVIQTTGRESYLRFIRWIKAYGGSNAVLSDFKRRWSTMDEQTVATRSRNADWDQIYAQGETLAKGLALHAQHHDYRPMSRTAADLLHVPANAGGHANPLGELGSIYAMGRIISGSSGYGAGIYRQRVLALMHGLLGL